jgi:hypothetical protein
MEATENGLWQRNTVLVARRANSNHPSSGTVLAPLNACWKKGSEERAIPFERLQSRRVKYRCQINAWFCMRDGRCVQAATGLTR